MHFFSRSDTARSKERNEPQALPLRDSGSNSVQSVIDYRAACYVPQGSRTGPMVSLGYKRELSREGKSEQIFNQSSQLWLYFLHSDN